MIFPVNPMVRLRKKPGDLSEASFNDPTDLHCSFIFKDIALGRTENLRRELRRTLVMELVKKEWNHRFW